MSNYVKSLVVRTIGIFCVGVAVYGYVTIDLKLIVAFVVLGLIAGFASIYFKVKPEHKDQKTIATETLSKLVKK